MFDTNARNVTLPVRQDKVTLLVLVVIEVIGVVGNLLFLSVITFRRSFRTKRSRTYIYLAFVSIVNIGLNLFVIPFAIVTRIYGMWKFNEEICYFNAFMNSFWFTLCVYSMTLLSLHKYFSIVRPLKYTAERKHITFLIITTITMSLIITSIPFMFLNVTFSPVIAQCIVSLYTKKYSYVAFLLVLLFVGPLVMNIFIHVRIYFSLKKHRKRMTFSSIYNARALQSQQRITKTLHVVLFSFIISWTPFFIYAIVFIIDDESPISDKFMKIAYLIGFSNSAQNALIFIFRTINIKQMILNICMSRKETGILEYSGSRRAFAFDDERSASLFIRSRNKKTVFYAKSNSKKLEEIRFHSYFNRQCDDAN